jgi:hypothetical protein
MVIAVRAAAVLALGAIMLTAVACGGGNHPSAATPVPSMTIAAPPATSTPFPSTPSAPYVGPARELGRNDCPSDWLAWVSQPTGFSVCYPPSWRQSTGYPWYSGTVMRFRQEGSSVDAAAVAVSYVTNYTGGPWFECDKPESVELLGHAGKLCVWENGEIPAGLVHTPLIVEAYGYYVP